MIREIKRYKSVRDYLTNDLHCEGVSFWKSDDKERNRKCFWIALICPYCAQKQYIRWDWHDRLPLFLHDDAHGTDEAQGLYLNKIFHDVDDFLRNNFNCDSCGKHLSLRPGYYFSSSQDLRFLQYHKKEYFVENVFIPYGYKHNGLVGHDKYIDSLYFDGYEDGSLYQKYSERKERISEAPAYCWDEIWNLRNDDSVYDDNSISKSYIKDILDESDIAEASIGLYATIGCVSDSGGYDTVKLSIEQIFGLMEYYQNYDEMYEEEVTNLILNETESIDNSVDVEPVRKELTLDQINEVLKEMIGFETLIISLHSRLKRLFLVKARENSKYLNISTQKEENEVENLKKRIQELASEREKVEFAPLDTDKFISKIVESKPKLSYPAKPIAPEEPVYEKPGLLNKKKVEASNEQKKQKYLEDLAKYNNAVLDYNIQVSRLEEIESKRKEEISKDATTLAQQEKQQKLLQINSQLTEAREKMVNINKALANKKLEIQAVKDNLSELPWNKEFDQAVDLLKKTLEAKIVYEKSEVIFPKYQNLVAYSQFYEYFQAGRCTSLTGPDGAYNLYEAELRQNIIIGKLDDISNSLEEIKQNQFMIYSELKSINSNISKLDDSMNKILGKVTEIGTNVEAIRNSTEIMEENSKIAAYYSKKNAELTNAMGYLVALK